MPEVEVVPAPERAADSFRAVVEEHSRMVFRLAFRMTGNAEDAEDVVQETFLKAHRSFGRFDARASVATWIYRIALNAAIDVLAAARRPALRALTAAGTPTPRSEALPVFIPRIEATRNLFSSRQGHGSLAKPALSGSLAESRETRSLAALGMTREGEGRSG